MQIVDEIGIVLVAVLQVLVILVLFDIEFVTEKRVERPDDQYARVRFWDTTSMVSLPSDFDIASRVLASCPPRNSRLSQLPVSSPMICRTSF